MLAKANSKVRRMYLRSYVREVPQGSKPFFKSLSLPCPTKQPIPKNTTVYGQRLIKKSSLCYKRRKLVMNFKQQSTYEFKHEHHKHKEEAYQEPRRVSLL